MIPPQKSDGHHPYQTARTVLLAILCLLIGHRTFAAEHPVQITPRQDGGVEIATQTYGAEIDEAGNLHLVVGDVNAVYGGFCRTERESRQEYRWVPLSNSPTINVTERRVAISDGDARIEYVFAPENIQVDSEGYSLLYRYLKAAIAGSGPGGSGGPVSQKKGAGSIQNVILNNGLRIQFSTPFHMVERRRSYLIPSAYLNGQKNRGERLTFTITPGLSATSAQYLSDLSVRGTTTSREWLRRGGNRGGIPHFPDCANVRFFTAQQNIAEESFDDVTYTFRVLDHYLEGEEVFLERNTATVPAGDKLVLDWTLPKLTPGFYYARASARKKEDKLAGARMAFAVDLAGYDHPLTRPGDFQDFWTTLKQDLRDRPFNVNRTEIPEKGTERVVHYRLEITGWKGKRYTCVLEVPRREGQYRGMISGKSDGHTVAVAPRRQEEKRGWPESATFRRWDGPKDNNMLECIMLALRLTDYLRSRDDVAGIYLRGASRTGPIQFINAALDPRKIEAVDIHVPTSAGISWMDKKYRGWGGKPRDLGWETWTSMAAYVDPVNHAPDMRVPLIVAYGIADDLASPQGIEVMFQKANSPWKRISRDRGGHQFSRGFRHIRRQLADYLDKHELERSREEQDILKEH